jgi:cytoplasmic iron level regulating protein YaaA (DUF328/UPF0246 family)
MLAVISPAKTLDYDTPAPTERFTQPDFLDDSRQLMDPLRQLMPSDLARLMKLSDKLAALNVARFGQWQPNFTLDNAKQALFAFKGDVYTGLEASTLSLAQHDFAQQHLRILSGLYGLLRPLDLMMPYRLEMGTRLANSRGKDLYQFWGSIIANALNEALASQGDTILVNLASNEYFKAVDKKCLDATIVTPVFKDFKSGEYKVISFYAKKARGRMLRYIIEQQISQPERLCEFNWDGYTFCTSESSDSQLIFKRRL